MSKHTSTVMPGLGPGIHVLLLDDKLWLAGTSPVMTKHITSQT
jgi:hypothetical protein